MCPFVSTTASLSGSVFALARQARPCLTVCAATPRKALDDLGAETDSAAELAADGIVTRGQIDAVLSYRSAYPDEIQARIDLHRSETAAAEAR